MITHKTTLSRLNRSDSDKKNYLPSKENLSVNFETYNVLGVILSKQKKYNDANQAYRKAIEINENYGIAYYNLALLLIDREKYEEISDTEMPILICASAAGHVDVVMLLLNEGANIHISDKRGRSALMWASNYGHLKTVSLLLEKEAEIEGVDNHGRTPLIYASSHGQSEVSTLLLNNGANVDAVDHDGRSALIWASALGHIHIVDLLLNYGANIYAADSANFVALIWACVNDHIEVAKLLLERGAVIDASDKDERTALIWASAAGHLELVELLLKYSANIHFADNLGYTAFYWACINNHIEVATLLMNYGANIDTVDKNDHTALMLTSERGNADFVKWLLNKTTNHIVDNNDQYDLNDEMAVEAFLKGFHVSHEKYLILDKINELDLDITYLEQTIINTYPYIIERQQHLLRDKLDKAKGKLKDALDEVASIPFPERKEIINQHLNQLELLKGESAPPLPSPDFSGQTYPLYTKRTDPFKHLEEVWGKWLVRYTPSLKQDYLDQKQLRERDPVLFTALSNRLKRTGKEHIRDYIPPYRSPFPP